MAIEKCCDNCVFNFSSCENVCCTCQDEEKNYDYFEPKEEVIRQDYKSQLIHDFREYIDSVIKYYNSTCGTPDEYEYGLRKGFEVAIKYIIKYDYKEE